MQIKIKKLNQEVKLPTYGYPGDAGMDFYTQTIINFAPGEQKRISTGVALEIPEGYVGLV